MLSSQGLRRAFAATVAAGALILLPTLPAAAATAAAPGSHAASSGAVEVSAAAVDEVRDQQQWVLNMLDVEPAWSVTEGANVTVAVIDSGVNPDVSDLVGSVISGPDYTGLKTAPSNPDWGQHGTWMASIIAGHGDGGADGTIGPDGIVGVAPEAKILSIRVIPDTTDPGYRTYDNEPEQKIQDELAHGIRTAVQDHAQVISMSIGYSQPAGVVRDAIDYAYSHGVVLVASSGNSGDNDTQHGTSNPDIAQLSYPADYPGVLGVGAVTIDGVPATFSSGNLSVQIAAPGKGVPAQGRNGLYYTVDGTSPACALVAGVAALLKSRYPKITPAQVTEALTTTAQQSPPGSYSVLTGFGIVDADAALLKAGQLMQTKAEGSQVAASAHFGGGPAEVQAAPVTPRGGGWLEASVVLAVVAAIVLAAGGAGLYIARQPRRW